MPQIESQSRSGVTLYFGGVFLLLTFSSPLDGISTVPIQYILKDTLQSTPVQLALYALCINIPVYLGAVFGVFRDYLQYSIAIDRIFMGLSGAAGIVGFTYLASLSTSSLTFVTLLLTVTTIGAALSAFSACVLALMTRVALHNSLAAPLSVTWNVAIQLPIVISFFIGGWLVHAATPTTIFILSAMILFAVLACAILGQRLVERSLIGSIHSTDRNAFRAVFRSGRRFWLAIAIIALFTFQPGWQTPLFFYVTSTIKMTSTEYGLFMALITAFTIIGNLLFFIVARRRSLITVLWFGTTSIVLQSPLPFLIDSAASGYAVAMISGLMYGFAIAGYWALLLSSSPVGLEGTAYTTAIAVSMMGTRFGDLFGSWLYQQVGFSIPIVLTTFIMTLIFPVIYLVSRHDSTSGTREALQAG